jgi:hypothetical protein
MILSENAMSKKCKQEQETYYHILCPCLALANHRVGIFDMDTTDRYMEGLNQDNSGSRIKVRALPRSAVHNEPSRGLNAWVN